MRLFMLSLVLLIAVPAATQAQEPLKIGCVNLTAVLKEYDRRKEMENDLRNVTLSLRRDLESRMAKINRYRDEIEQLAEGSAERRALEDEARAALARYQQAAQENREMFDRQSALMMAGLYEDILREVEALAKEEGYDMVLKNQVSELEPMSHDQAVLQISQRVVLYSKPEHDISEALIARLNAAYAERKLEEAAEAEAKRDAPPDQEAEPTQEEE